MSTPLDALIQDLTQPAAYPYALSAVHVVQTHISIVFLAGDHVYKLKKPVQLGFLDFSTLEKRRHFCEEEVRLNRRLAPKVYLDVVPVTRGDKGHRFEGDGEAVEWAVKMSRLPDDATLENRLERGDIRTDQIESLARKVAQFHATAERSERIASFGKFEVVAGNMRENFAQTKAHVGPIVTQAVWQRLRERTEEQLAELQSLIEARARSMPCDTHGDLHLDHVYLFPDRTPPDDLVIIDCIEFNERFRFADPVADMAFLTMDLAYHGRRDLAKLFAEAYFAASGDAEGRRLLPLYSAYRAVVRAKVEGMAALETEIPAEEQSQHLQAAGGHWLLALGEIEVPNRRPCLVLIGGLPGSGKSTLARGLTEAGDWLWLRSDVVRKELAGVAEHERAASEHYGDAWSEKTYRELLRRAAAGLAEGRRVLIDANFRKHSQRQPFVELAQRCAVPIHFLVCQVSAATAQARLAQRKHDVSDADPQVYAKLASEWEAPHADLKPFTIILDGEAPSDALRQRAIETLSD